MRFDAAHPGRRQAGLTLVETLAVIVIIGMAAAMIAGGLVSNARLATAQTLMSRWRDLDVQARCAASAVGPVRLRLDVCHEDGPEMLSLEVAATGERLGVQALPAGFGASFILSGGESSRAVGFDARGRSEDYRFAVGDAGSSTFMCSQAICGLTGWPLRTEGGS